MWDRWSHGELFSFANAFCCFTDFGSSDDSSLIQNVWQMRDPQLSSELMKNLVTFVTENYINFVDLSQIKAFLNF